MRDHEVEYELLGWPDNAAILRERLDRTGLPAGVLDQIAATARPALMFSPVAVAEDEIPTGATKIGGRPDLPADFVWPTRAPYADARETADRELEWGGGLMALAGIAPPWMTPAKGKKFIEKTLREREKLGRSLAELRQESVDELAELENDDSIDEADKQAYREMLASSGDAFDLPPIPSVDEAEAAGRQAMMKAEALTGDFPLAFIAQIDFAALAKEPGFDPALPKTGRLYLFYDLLGLPSAYDPASRAGFRAVYDETPPGELIRRALPPPLAALEPVGEQALLPPAAVEIRSVVTTATQEACRYLGLKLRQTQASAYDEWLVDEAGWPGEAGRHQLGGWPRAIQTSMQAYCQFTFHDVDATTLGNWQGKKAKALLADADKWHLLFQLGPDNAQDAVLPGSINFLIREEDLAERRFDRVWAVYEQS